MQLPKNFHYFILTEIDFINIIRDRFLLFSARLTTSAEGKFDVFLLGFTILD